MGIFARHIGTVHLRQRWVENGLGNMVNSRRIPHGHRLRHKLDDTKNPPPSSNLLLIVDLLIVGSLGRCIQQGWLTVTKAIEERPDPDDLSLPDLVECMFTFFGMFFRPLIPIVFMWLFVNLIMGWFYLENQPMPLEYGGGNKSYKSSEIMLLPTMFCMLVLAYNNPVCILLYSSDRFGLKEVWTQRSLNCGHMLVNNVTMTADPSYFPAQPCTLITWGSCVFSTASHVVFKLFALLVLLYIKQNLGRDDLKASRKTLRVLMWTQMLGLCVRVATGVGQVVAAYEDPVPNRESSLYWPCLVMYNVAGMVEFAPFVWMIYLEFSRQKEYCLPFDSDFTKSRAATVFRVSMANMLLVGIQAEFHNGPQLGADLVYHTGLQANILGILLPLTVWGSKVLYFDSVHATPSQLSAVSMDYHHAVDAGYGHAMIWFSLQFIAVACSGMVTQCLVVIVKKGQFARTYERHIMTIAFAAFLLSLAGLAACHEYQGALRFRQRRRVVVRIVFASVMCLTSYAGTHTIPALTTWLAIWGFTGCALFERVLDQYYPNDDAYRKEDSLLEDENKGQHDRHRKEWRIKHAPTRHSVTDFEIKEWDVGSESEDDDEACAVIALAGDVDIGAMLISTDDAGAGDGGGDGGGDGDADGGHDAGDAGGGHAF